MQMNIYKYGHGETRNKKLINEKRRYHARMAVLQSLILSWKKQGEKRKKKLFRHGVSNLVMHPSTNPAEQGFVEQTKHVPCGIVTLR